MVYLIENELLRVEINQRGAELFSFFSKKLQKEFLWNGNPEFWPRRSPILFPIIGRLKGDKYRIGDKFYTMSQHGFARDSMFVLKEKKNDKIIFELTETDESLKIYPFRFKLRMTYKIVKNEVFAVAEIENRKEENLPFSFGFHPAFVCPFDKSETLKDYAVVFEKEEICERLFLENGLISNKEKFNISDRVLTLSENLFADDAVILKNVLSKKVSLQRKDEGNSKIELAFKGFSYLGLWKKQDAPFLCIEPWSGLPDYKESDNDFVRKDGIILLEKNERKTFEMKIGLFE